MARFIKNKGTPAFIALAALSAYFAFGSMADTIILKNGRSIKGAVNDESEEAITLNVDGADIVFSRSEIASVSKDEGSAEAKASNSAEGGYFESLPAPTPEAQKFLDDYNELVRSKRSMAGKAAQRNALSKKISESEKEIFSLEDKLVGLSKEIKNVNAKKRTLKYNSITIDINLIQDELKKSREKKASLKEKRSELDKDIQNRISRFAFFEKKLRKKISGLSASGPAGPEREAFYNTLAEKFSYLREKMQYREIGAENRAGNIVATVLFNGGIKAKMLVDTGSALTVISENLAAKMNMGPSECARRINLTMANGQNVSAKAVMFDSVDVGGMRAENVPGAIVKGSGGQDIDGLLGMSFLSNFLFSINTQKGKIIFASFDD